MNKTQYAEYVQTVPQKIKITVTTEFMDEEEAMDILPPRFL
jgi:hypothetical protein